MFIGSVKKNKKQCLSVLLCGTSVNLYTSMCFSTASFFIFFSYWSTINIYRFEIFYA